MCSVHCADWVHYDFMFSVHCGPLIDTSHFKKIFDAKLDHLSNVEFTIHLCSCFNKQAVIHSALHYICRQLSWLWKMWHIMNSI